MAYKRISPQPVVEGGTGAQTFTSHGVLLGNTASAISVTAAGTTGQVLTGVTGSAPTFQSPASSSITITGDSGGGLTGNSFTFTGASTGLTFSGSGTTETITGTLVVGNGGTGATTFTSHGVLLGNTTSAITATAAGTTGQVLTGVTGSAPTFQSPAASSITITGDSGGGLTGASFTFTGGTTGLTFAGAGSTETLGGTLVVSNGGTGAATLTSHGVLLGNGTSAVTATTAGTTGQVLTGVTGSAPTFQSPAASSISITGDSGGALTGAAFTFTGGTTGLTFAGAGSTETLGGTLVVSNGGTGRASSTAYAVVCGGTTSTAAQQSIASVGTSGQVLTSNGAGALPTFQAAGGGGPGTNIFLAYLNTTVSNATGNAVQYTVVFDSTFNNPGSNYNTGTGNFTAPATGNYQFNFLVSMGNLGANTRAIVYLVTTSATYKPYDVVPVAGGGGELIYSFSTLARMTSGDTANVQVRVFGGTQTVNVEGSSGGSSYPSIFNGWYVSA